MKTRVTPLPIQSAMGATAALAFGSPTVLAMAGATAVSTYAWRMALAGPYMAMRGGKGASGDLVEAATKQAEAVVDAALKLVKTPAAAAVGVPDAAQDAAENVETAAEAKTPFASDAVPPKPVAEPASAAPVAEVVSAEQTPPATRPKAMKAPRKGVADDLTAMKGIGPKLAEKLGEMGIFHYDQIAAWTEAEVAWMDENLGRPAGRVSRDNWVAAAAALKG